MSALLLQTVLLVFMCHGDSVFHWLELCWLPPIFLGPHVCKLYQLIYLTVQTYICYCYQVPVVTNLYNTNLHALTPAACAFQPGSCNAYPNLFEIKSCHTTVTVSLQVTCNTGDNATLQEHHTTCKRKRIRIQNNRFWQKIMPAACAASTEFWVHSCAHDCFKNHPTEWWLTSQLPPRLSFVVTSAMHMTSSAISMTILSFPLDSLTFIVLACLM